MPRSDSDSETSKSHSDFSSPDFNQSIYYKDFSQIIKPAKLDTTMVDENDNAAMQTRSQTSAQREAEKNLRDKAMKTFNEEKPELTQSPREQINAVFLEQFRKRPEAWIDNFKYSIFINT
jgi:hypothetical protein